MAARSQQRLAASAAAAVRRWMSSAATSRRIASVHSNFQELSTVKDLSTSVYRLEESIRSQSTSFWVLVAVLIPSAITVKSTQDSQEAELKRLRSDKEKSETASKSLENRVLALELGNLYAEKYCNVSPSLPAPKVNGDIASPAPSKVDGDAP